MIHNLDVLVISKIAITFAALKSSALKSFLLEAVIYLAYYESKIIISQ